MELLYSNILPLRTTEHQRTIADCIGEQLMQADRVDIAVGYVSRASLEEIDRLADELHVAHIVLTIGMYYIEGMPESAYRTAMHLNEKWMRSGVGEVRIVKSFKYHGKVYLFSKERAAVENRETIPVSAIIGWSRELPPYYLAIAGLHHPLREPYLPLSKYTALSLFGQKNSLIVN